MQNHADQLSQLLGDRYTVLDEIGAGGMATVYLATDHKHGRQVAVKVLRPELAEIVGTDRFRREIEIAASLTHPHILPLHDSGGSGRHLYYVMPFIEGESLGQRLERDNRLEVSDALRLFQQVVDALGAAHGRGVVHRDIKPANILLNGTHALVADFGIARALSDVSTDSRLTTVGVSMGTPHYMAPEQATADPDVDQRADLFSAGAVLYEMLTGSPPFPGDSTRAVLTAVLTTTPEEPREVRSDVPQAINDLVMWCLHKDAADRPQSAQELLDRLELAYSPTGGNSPASETAVLRRSPVGLMGIAAAALAVGLVGWQWTQQRSQLEWARQEGLPEVIRLVDANRLTEAATLAGQVEGVLGADPVLDPIWPRMSTPYSIATQPAGALISYRPYESESDGWVELGTTPYEADRFPVGAYRFRLELPGFETIEVARSLIPSNLLGSIKNSGFDYLSDPTYVIDEVLWEPGSVPDGMIPVRGGVTGTSSLLGFDAVQPVQIPDFLIQRHEVTNAEYLEFVEAGGYANPTFWSDSFVRGGASLSFDEAMAALVDETGRPGPSTWSLSAPPQGADNFPVSGVSWFEADAYCRWKGRDLPTIYHWARAALPSTDVWIAFNTLLGRASNFGGEGPAVVGSLGAISVTGAQDTGGNVREWSYTTGGSERMSLGGGWSDPLYWLHDSYSASPWLRAPADGVRCVQYSGGEVPPHLRTDFSLPAQDLSRQATMSDEAFRLTQQFSAYDRSVALDAVVESTDDTDWGVEEWVTINTAYGERMPVRITLPVGHTPPYPALIFMNGGNVLRSAEMEDSQPPLPQLVRAGFAVVEAAFDGTYQRNDGRILARIRENFPQVIANWVKDLGRTLDYLEERPDVDDGRVAWMGISLGATIAPRLLPLEPRIGAVVLYSGGISRISSQSSVDQITGLADRVDVPVLMMGGRDDFHLPEASADALFRAFGTSDSMKTLRLLDAGHWPLPMGEVLTETMNFLETHLGPSPRE